MALERLARVDKRRRLEQLFELRAEAWVDVDAACREGGDGAECRERDQCGGEEEAWDSRSVTRLAQMKYSCGGFADKRE